MTGFEWFIAVFAAIGIGTASYGVACAAVYVWIRRPYREDDS